ncbi:MULTISPECIES: hypothetical protein [Luteimonas]|uniref:hypothetical protein n=1 Tax=Luteimonas TaxID=83614 RepID=UPI000C7E1C27|nr:MULTISPECIES: hypothetical protein [Luteimonas]
MAEQQTGLVIRLDSVRLALWANQHQGRDEPRERVIARVIADTRDGFHQYPPPTPRHATGAHA